MDTSHMIKRLNGKRSIKGVLNIVWLEFSLDRKKNHRLQKDSLSLSARHRAGG